jgi:hypothetical protein
MHRLIQWIFGRSNRMDAVALAEFRKHMLDVVREVQLLSTENKDLREKSDRLTAILNDGTYLKEYDAIIDELEEELADLKEMLRDDPFKQLAALNRKLGRTTERLEDYRDMMCNLAYATVALVGLKRASGQASYLAAAAFIKRDHADNPDFDLPLIEVYSEPKRVPSFPDLD